MELRAPGFKLTGQKPFCGSAMGFMQVAEYTPSVNDRVEFQQATMGQPRRRAPVNPSASFVHF